MTKVEKESLWAQDRALQQLANSSAAAALLVGGAGLEASPHMVLDAHHLAAIAALAGGFQGL